MVALCNKYLKYFFPVLLVLLTVIICALNFTPGTFLSGWDTLHPEFDFSLNLKNLLFGTFRSDQGLGAVAAHSHMSEIPRLMVLWVTSLFFSLSFLRYLYVFITLVLGPLGVYFLIRSLLSKLPKNISLPSAFLGGLFYLFNLVTVQQFYVPFEMFLVQYAALGWLFLFTTRYLYSKKPRELFILSFITFFAAPMAYAFLLFYAYLAAIFLFMGTLYVLDRENIKLKQILLILLTTFIMNAFWLLPHFYFLATSAHEIPYAQTNRLFSEEAFLHNKQYGNVKDTAIFKNFLFNWTEVTTSQSLLYAWIAHLNKWGVSLIGYLGFFISLIGAIYSIYKRKKGLIALLPAGLLSFIMIISMNPPLDFFFSYFREHSSLFREGLRFPFTKFSILLVFVVSIYFAAGVSFILNILQKLHKPFKVYVSLVIIMLLAILLIYYGKPMFEGELISKAMRVKIPDEYFQFYKFMQDKPESARIAPLPRHSIWGWEYYDWGYMGAGFLWFGLKQPVLARDFDRWNASNEQYYKEMSSALYARDVKAVESLAQKYRIGYFLLDKHIVSPGSKPNVLWLYETEDLFSKSEKIRLVKTFNNSLFVYKVNLKNDNNSFVSAPEKITTVGPVLTGGFADSATLEFGDYYEAQNADVLYPVRNLMNRYGIIDPKNIVMNEKNLLIKFPSITPNNYNLDYEWLNNTIYPDTLLEQPKTLQAEIESLPYRIGNDFYLSVPVNTQPTSLASIRYNPECNNIIKPLLSRLIVKQNFVSFSSIRGELCSYFDFNQAPHDLGNLVIIDARNRSGLPLRVCITDNITKRCDVYTALSQNKEFYRYYFVVPPLPTGSAGYAVHFNNVSIGEVASINDVSRVQVVSLPYYKLQRIRLFKNDSQITKTNGASINQVNSKNPNFYLVNLSLSDQNSQNIVTLSKAYDAGWKAYEINNMLEQLFPFLGKQIKNHILVNNWENGWIIKNNNTTVDLAIIYLPEYLEIIGIIALGAYFPIFIILTHKKRGRHSHN